MTFWPRGLPHAVPPSYPRGKSWQGRTTEEALDLLGSLWTWTTVSRRCAGWWRRSGPAAAPREGPARQLEQARSTWDNIKYSLPVAEQFTAIKIASDPFHVRKRSATSPGSGRISSLAWSLRPATGPVSTCCSRQPSWRRRRSGGHRGSPRSAGGRATSALRHAWVDCPRRRRAGLTTSSVGRRGMGDVPGAALAHRCGRGMRVMEQRCRRGSIAAALPSKSRDSHAAWVLRGSPGESSCRDQPGGVIVPGSALGSHRARVRW
jgi:hypothetical protein